MSRDDDRDLSGLYRAGAREEPPPSLDRRIEQAARGMTRPSIWERLLNGGSGWRLGFSAFALVVLSVSLVTLVHEEAPLVPEAGAPAAAVPSAPGASEIAESSPMALNGTDPVPRRDESKPTPQAFDSLAEPVVPREQSSEMRRRAAPTDAISQKRDGPDRSAERQAASGASAYPKSEEIREERVAAAPPPPATAAPAAPSTNDTRVSPAMKSPRRAFESTDRTMPASPDGASMESPDVWLVRIEGLLRDGREHEAASEMNRFRGRYPDHPVPAALKGLVERSEPQPR